MNIENRETHQQALDAVFELLRKHHIEATETLTQNQMAECIVQALACGDFERQIMVGSGAQAVTYIPFRQQERLLERIKQLEEEVADLETKLSNAEDAYQYRTD